MKPAELRAWRLKSGLTQVQLARLLDVDPSTVARIEQGQRSGSWVLRHLTVQRLDQIKNDAEETWEKRTAAIRARGRQTKA